MNRAGVVLRYLSLKEASKKIIEEMNKLDREFGAHEEEIGDIKLTVHVHGIYIERKSTNSGLYLSWEDLGNILEITIKMLGGKDILKTLIESEGGDNNGRN